MRRCTDEGSEGKPERNSKRSEDEQRAELESGKKSSERSERYKESCVAPLSWHGADTT